MNPSASIRTSYVAARRGKRDESSDSAAPPGGPGRGAYGLRFAGLGDEAALLSGVDSGWPCVEISQRVAATEAVRFDRFGEDRAQVRLRTGGRIELRRDPTSATFFVSRRLPDAAIVHPYLAPVAAVVNRWARRETFHAAAIAYGQDVWGLLGDRESGKSSTVAHLATRGVDVVCDDLLVVDGQTAYAGPRFVDLRADAAHRLSLGESAGVLGARERFRVRLAALDRPLCLRGWIALRWAERIRVRALRPGEKLQLLVGHAGLRLPSMAPEQLLRLAACPGYVVERPRGWRSLADTADEITRITRL